MKLSWLIPLFAFIVVAAQPVLGWHAIPSYFNYSVFSAIVLGVADALLLVCSFYLGAYLNGDFS